MAFSNLPPSAGTDLTDYERITQLWKAIREREIVALGASTYPRSSLIWNGVDSTVTAITSGTMTDSTQAWSANYWTSDLGVPDRPSSFEVWIGDRFGDPWKMVRATISSHTATVLTISDITQYVTEKRISALSDLVGKPYYIIGQNRYMWSQRWPDWTNDYEYARGTVTTSASGFITDTTQTFKSYPSGTALNFTNRDLVVNCMNGTLHRIPITSNDLHKINFASQLSIPTSGSEYRIVATNGRCQLGQTSYAPGKWYAGLMESAPSISPTRTVGSIETPTQTISRGSPPEVVTVFDSDVWNSWDGDSPQDMPYGPNIHKSLRWLQVWCEANCESFVDKARGNGSKSLRVFTKAEFFKKFGAYYKSATITSFSGGSCHFSSVGWDYSPIDVHYAIINEDTDAVMFSSSSDMITVDNTSIAAGDATCVGKTIIMSPGWDRYFPREFQYLYKHHFELPAADPLDPNIWTKRAASTLYAEFDNRGYRITGDAFASGDYARYVGDNYYDPFPNDVGVSPSDTDLPYLAQSAIKWRSQEYGPVTSGTRTTLVDSDKNWWTNGVRRTETGTATGGSTTILIDTTKSGNAYWQSFTGRWLDFIIEITTPSGVYKRPITNFSGTTITWAEALPIAVSGGTTYQIREPRYVMNNWQGRVVKIAKPDNTIASGVITYSDDTTLWFADIGFTVDSTMKYAIVENQPGEVMQYSGSIWNNVAKPIGKNPTIKKKYGRIRKGDYHNDVNGPFKQITNGLKELVVTKTTFEWRDLGADNNSKTAGGGAVDDEDSDWSAAVAGADANWAADIPGPNPGDPGPPTAYSDGRREYYVAPPVPPPAINHTNIEYVRVCNSGVANGLSTIRTCTAQAYVLGAKAGEDYTDTVAGITDHFTYEFSANGDSIAEGTYTTYSSVTSNASERNFGIFGSLNKPNATTMPSHPTATDNYNTWKGYVITDTCVLMRWNVASGFEYY